MEQAKSNKIYKYKNRVIIRTLLAIFTIAMVVFGSLLAYVLAMVGTDEIFSQGSGQSTLSYQNLVDAEVQMVRNSLDARRQFETNGEFDADKTIDIMNPEETDVNKQNKNTTFTVEDITTMSRNDVFSGIEDISDNVVPFFTGQAENYSNFEGKETYELSNAASGEVVSSEVAPGSKQQMGELLDRMNALALETPVSDKPLMEYVQNNSDNVTSLVVFHALNNLRGMMREYDESAAKSSAIGTNLRYYIKDNENGEVVTNSEWKSLAEAKQSAKANGLLIECKRDATGCVVGKGSTAGFDSAKQEIKQRPIISKSEEVVITVDENYPVEDQLSEFIYGYNHLKPYFEPFLVWVILSLIGLVVCFILATVTTGQDEKEGVVRLNIFDRIPTEIGAGIVCLLGIINIAIITEAYDNVSNGAGHVIISLLYVIGLLTTCALIATWGYLSLTRRIKAKDLWKNSLCRRIFSTLRSIYYAGKMSVRLVISFVVFALAHVFFVVTLGVPGVIILLTADAIILVHLLKEVNERQKIKDGLETIAAGNLDYKLDTTNLQQDNKEIAEAANKIADGLQNAVEKSMKNERMRSELITNVSHDIKTPLTSIINYVDLLKREDIQNPQVKGYIDILDAKSQRLKHLTEDLVEASKVSSGNVELHMDNLFVQELLQQAEGEVSEELKARNLELVSSLTAEPAIIKADGRQMWRIFENLLNNIAKYALEGTRVYIDLTKENKKATLMFKNMSQEALNINADELTERFVRGDISRTTEGSGLGLSIAKSLTELQGGEFEIYLDGDLFKVTLTFDTV